MSKRIILRAVFVLFALVFLTGLAGCNTEKMMDKLLLPEDYVEVEELRIRGGANIRLSTPPEDTSKVKLDIEVLPSDATNKALEYYIPSEYWPYVSVDEGGTISSREKTPEGISVPLFINSTTNKKAKLTVNIIVEDVPVERIYFIPEKMTMLYNDEPRRIQLEFEPRHAKNGRTVEFEVLDDEVAEVSDAGKIIPKKAGTTRVIARTTGLDREVEGRMEVTVKYAKGRYRLVVTDENPAYKQVVRHGADKENYKPIKFYLESLNPHSNPYKKIYWYVAGQRQAEYDDSEAYLHIPNTEIPAEYRVEAEVDDGQGKQNCFSEQIGIYNPFTGYDLILDNLAAVKLGFEDKLPTDGGFDYQYGDTVTFSLPENPSDAEKYDWYLRRNKSNERYLVADGRSPSDRDLKVRLNIEGDFVLTAEGKTAAGKTVIEKKFEFSVTKFSVNDKVYFTPVMRENGIPPESFTFYFHKTDIDGEAAPRTDGVVPREMIGAVPFGESFVYTLKDSGVIYSGAVLDGVDARASDDAEPFLIDRFKTGRESDSPSILRCYPADFVDSSKEDDIYRGSGKFDYEFVSKTRIRNVKIEGANYDGKNLICLEWDNTRGAAPYYAEITKEDEKTVVLSSKYYEWAGDNKLLLKEDIVGIDEKFSVRIKSAGSLYSPSYYYGYNTPSGERSARYFPMIKEEEYPYLRTLGEKNTYFTDVGELGEFLNFLFDARPDRREGLEKKVRSVESGERVVVYNFKALFKFDAEAAAEKYPVDPLEICEGPKTAAAILSGAVRAYLPAWRYVFSIKETKGAENAFEIEFGFAGKFPEPEVVEIREVVRGEASDFYSAKPYGKGNKEFPIKYRGEMKANDSRELFEAIEKGYRPEITDGTLSKLYDTICETVNSVTNGEMTDGEKARAFFDWLALNVVYDRGVEASVGKNPDAAYNNRAYKLEGVFEDKQAVGEGFAQAFAVLCGIEGIPCGRVAGKADGKAHVWNKVLIEDEWKIVDAANGSVLTAENKLIADERFFALSDRGYAALFEGETEEFGIYPSAE